MAIKKQLEKGNFIGFQQIMKNIQTAFDELTGDDIAEIHNKVCARKVEYCGDSIWKYTGEKD
jgi:hypothetical protein